MEILRKFGSKDQDFGILSGLSGLVSQRPVWKLKEAPRSTKKMEKFL
jgi:hypothetical protein